MLPRRGPSNGINSNYCTLTLQLYCALCVSLIPRPHPHEGKGLVAFERFLGLHSTSANAIPLTIPPSTTTVLPNFTVEALEGKSFHKPQIMSLLQCCFFTAAKRNFIHTSQGQRWPRPSINGFPMETVAGFPRLSVHLFPKPCGQVYYHSTHHQKTRMKLKPMVLAREALVTDPGMGRKKLSKEARSMVSEDESANRLATMISAEQRSEALCTVEEEAAAEWVSALERLSPLQMKFALNASQDTLPHSANLALWRGHPSECRLCGDTQTLLHVLCSCPVALQLRQFNVRHDQVLRVTVSSIS